MRIHHRPARRTGFAAMDAVLTMAVSLPASAALFWVFVRGCDAYFFILGAGLGWVP
jgi:hypothetical protein